MDPAVCEIETRTDILDIIVRRGHRQLEQGMMLDLLWSWMSRLERSSEHLPVFELLGLLLELQLTFFFLGHGR